MSNARYGLRTLTTGEVRTLARRNVLPFVSAETDADAFLIATGITDVTISNAIKNLVFALKEDGIWSKMKAIYPFVGGTATTHKYNLKDPQDTDGAFRLVFAGGLTHSSNGVLPNGSNGYAETKLIPDNIVTEANSHISYYSRTNNNPGSDFDMGVSQPNGTRSFSMFLRRSDNTAGFDSGNASGELRISASSQTNSQGHYIGTIRSTTDRIYIKNGTTTLASSTTNNTNDLMDSQIILFAVNHRTFGSVGLTPSFHGSKQCAFASIGDGLTNTEASDLYTAVQAFQTALSREV